MSWKDFVKTDVRCTTSEARLVHRCRGVVYILAGRGPSCGHVKTVLPVQDGRLNLWGSRDDTADESIRGIYDPFGGGVIAVQSRAVSPPPRTQLAQTGTNTLRVLPQPGSFVQSYIVNEDLTS